MLRDWEEAADIARNRAAVAKFLPLVRDTFGNMVKADIIKEKGKDGYLVYRGTTRKIRAATTQEIDSTKNWRPW